MPLSKKEFAEVVRQVGPEKAVEEALKMERGQQAAAPPQDEKSLALKFWELINRPLVGGEDALLLEHEHGPDESTARRFAEDLGAGLTSPLSVATTATGIGAAAAGAKGLLGISRAARAAEAAMQAPVVAEGVHNVVTEDSAGGKTAGAVQALLGGLGVRSAARHAFPAKKVVDTYVKEKGLPRVQLKGDVDPTRSMKIADAYEAMKNAPDDPKVAASYKALGDEIEQQYDFLVNRAGVKMEPWTKSGQPYANSAEMVADVEKNNHLFYFPTEAGYGQGEAVTHPLLAKGKDGIVLNDKFRAVHDYFGHVKNRNQFGPKGEEGAYLDHLPTFTPEARGALTTETRGQNSWVNFGPAMRGPSGALLKKGDEGWLPPQDRPYAEQKVGLLPEEFVGSVPEAVAPERATLLDRIRGTATESGATGSTPLSDEELIALALQGTERTGGATINRFAGNLAGQDRYAVAKFPGQSRSVSPENLPAALREFIEANRALLDDPENSLGVWVPQGRDAILDVAGTPGRLDDALRIGARQTKGPVGVLTRGNAPPPEESIFDLRALTPEGDIKPSLKGTAEPGIIPVRPNVPPAVNALLADQRGELRLPRTGERAAAPAQAALPLGKRGTGPERNPKLLAKASGPSEPVRPSKLPDRPFPKPSVLDELYQNGIEGAKWYEETGTKLTQMLGDERAGKLIDFLAATSPNASVKANAKFAIKALEQLEGGEEFKGFLGNVIKDLRKAAAGDVFGGKKVQAFAKALKGDPNAVVVDRWVMRAFGFPEGKSPSPKVYDKISDIITQRAKFLGVSPREYQASLWLAAKKAAGRVGDTGDAFEVIIEDLIRQPSLFNPKGLLKKFPDEVVLEHRSQVPNLKEVDPSFYGKGLAGAEAKRKQNYPTDFVDRSYYTVKGQPFEKKFTKLYAYESAPIPKDRIYDFGKDPRKILDLAVEFAGGDPGLANTIKEAIARNQGFLGYMDSTLEDPVMRNAVAVFEKLPVRRVK